MPINNIQKYLVGAVPLIIIALAVYYFSEIVNYVILAWVVSMIGVPIHQFFVRFVGPSVAAAFTLLLFSLFLIAFMYVLIPPVVQQAQKFATIDYNAIVTSFEEPLNDWNDWLVEKKLLPEENDITQETILDTTEVDHQLVELDTILSHYQADSNLTALTIVINVPTHQEETHIPHTDINTDDDFFDRAKKSLFKLLDPSRITDIFGSVVGFVGNLLITILSVLFIAFFFLKEQGLFTKIIKALVSDRHEDQAVHAVDESSRLLKRYFVGIVVQICIITTYIYFVLTFLGYQNALLIALFASFLNVVPYIGPIMGAAFGVLIVISGNLELSFYNELLPKILKIIAVFASMQLIDNFILQPNIFSKSVKAHPLEIFIIVLIGAKLGGVMGMVLAIPAYTIIRVLAKVFFNEFKIVQRITSRL